MKAGKKTEEVKVTENRESREYYMKEIKKKLPEIESMEAMKAVYGAVVMCLENQSLPR